MNRRKFLKAIAALPLVPAAIRGWAEKKAEAVEVEPAVQLNDRLLAYAAGDPTVTVTVPPDQLLKISGMALLAGDGQPAELRIYEGDTLLAVTANLFGAELRELHTLVHVAPTPGTHTYRLGFRGAVDRGPLYPPTIWVERW